MSSVIQNLLHNTLGDGARSTKFDAAFQFTSDDAPNSKGVTASVKTSSFPGKSHTPMNIKHRGKNIPVRGTVKYSQQWECTFYLDVNHSLKHEFELWIEALDETRNYANDSDINGLDGLQSSHNNSGYFRDINIYQLDFDDETMTSKYTLVNAFPTGVSAVTTSFEGSSKVLEFTVTFSYTHYIHQVLIGNSGNFIDGLITTSTEIATSIGNSISSFISDQVGNSLNVLSDLNNGTTTSITTSLDNALLALNTGGISKDDMPSCLV